MLSPTFQLPFSLTISSLLQLICTNLLRSKEYYMRKTFCPWTFCRKNNRTGFLPEYIYLLIIRISSNYEISFYYYGAKSLTLKRAYNSANRNSTRKYQENGLLLVLFDKVCKDKKFFYHSSICSTKAKNLVVVQQGRKESTGTTRHCRHE